MGVYYSQYLVPKSGAVSYQPDDATLKALVHCLEHLRWIDPGWRSVPLVGIEHTSKMAPRGIAEDLGVFRALGSPLVVGPFPSPMPEVFWNEQRVRSDGLSRAYDFREDPEGVLLPRYNDEVRIVVADVTCLVSTNAYAETYPDQEECASCGADLVFEVSELYGEDAEREFWFGAAGVNRVLPDPCRSCGAAVDLEKLGHLPLFRFAVVLDPPPKATPDGGDGAADPELLRALREVTGVDFEMIARWS